jgi:hypothetical protein
MSDKLISGMDYQRTIKSKHVSEIADSFNPLLFEPPVVVYYGEKYYLVEGQHRVSALVMMNGGKPTPITCRVHNGCYTDGAGVIQNHDKGRMHQTQYQTIYAAGRAGDEDAERFLDTNTALGIRLLGSDAKKGYFFQASGTLYAMFKKYGPNAYTRVMSMFCGTFGNNQGAHDARFIKAVFAFDSKYQKKYRVSIFQNHLKGIDVRKMIANAKANNFALTDGLIYMIIPIYNRGLQESCKL